MRPHGSLAVAATLSIATREREAAQLADLEKAATSDGVRFSDFDLRRPDHRAACRRALTRVGKLKRGWSHTVARGNAKALVKMWMKDGPGVPHRLGSSQVEALGAMRTMGPGEAMREYIDPIDERRARNRRKRMRRERAS